MADAIVHLDVIQLHTAIIHLLLPCDTSGSATTMAQIMNSTVAKSASIHIIESKKFLLMLSGKSDFQKTHKASFHRLSDTSSALENIFCTSKTSLKKKHYTFYDNIELITSNSCT